MRYGRAAGLAALMGVLTAGCGDGIAAGTVTSKDYQPERNVSSLYCAARAPKTGGCTLWLPQTIHYAARYRLNLRDGGKHGWVDVDPQAFSRYRVGGHYPDPR